MISGDRQQRNQALWPETPPERITAVLGLMTAKVYNPLPLWASQLIPTLFKDTNLMSTPQPTQPEGLTAQRQAWIAKAAYYRAERRSFEGGCPIEDWLAAEREINPTAAEPASTPRVALVFLDRRPAFAAD